MLPWPARIVSKNITYIEHPFISLIIITSNQSLLFLTENARRILRIMFQTPTTNITLLNDDSRFLGFIATVPSCVYVIFYSKRQQ